MCNLSTLMGGPSGPTEGEQKDAQQTSQLAGAAQQNYSTEFGEQQQVLSQLNGEINRISSGNTGQGFSATENAARTSQIVSNADASALNNIQATQNRAAGASVLGQQDESGLARASGIRQEINGQISSQAEDQKSQALEANTAANYQQGRINAAQTASGLEALGGQYGQGAQAAGSLALGANNANFGQINQIKQQQDASQGALGSLIKTGIGLAGDFFTGGMSGLAGTGGESLIGKAGDFLKGGFNQANG